MLRLLKNRHYKTTKLGVLIFLLAFVMSFIILLKLLASDFNVPVKVINSPREVISDEENDLRKLMRLSERKRFDSKHEYNVVRFSQFHSKRQFNVTNFMKGQRYRYFLPEFKPQLLQCPSWFFMEEKFCRGCFVSYGKRIARLMNVLIDPSFAKNLRGGEHLESVLNQSEDSEYLQLEKGYFYLATINEFPHYKDEAVSNEFKVFLDALTAENMQIASDKVTRKTTIVIRRHEYANLYHTMMDWYGVFLIMILVHDDNVQILLLDAHPKSSLDETWKTLFVDVQQARSIKEPVLFQDMFWDAIGATSPLNQHKADILPFSKEFRHFFLSQHGIDDSHKMNCGNLRIRLISRQKYIAHPRNPTGYMTRKIKNENELLETLQHTFRHDNIKSGSLESLSMKEQVEIISHTDILIGMHGAGLTHILFLPNTSGVIEFFPRYFSSVNKHFHALAKWRRLDYMMWRNEDIELEDKDHFTVVPKDLLVEMVQQMRILLCGKLAELTKKSDEEDYMLEYDVD